MPHPQFDYYEKKLNEAREKRDYEKKLNVAREKRDKEVEHENVPEKSKQKDASSGNNYLNSFIQGATFGLAGDHHAKPGETKAERIGETAAEYAGMSLPLAPIGWGIKKLLPRLGLPGKVVAGAIESPGLIKGFRNFAKRAGGYSKIPQELLKQTKQWVKEKGIGGGTKEALLKSADWTANALGAKEFNALTKGNVKPLLGMTALGGGIGAGSKLLQEEAQISPLTSDILAGGVIAASPFAAKYIVNVLRDFLNPQGMIERKITRDIGHHLRGESSVHEVDPSTGETKIKLDTTPYEERLERFKKNPIEGYDETVIEKLLAEEGEKDLPGMSQIFRMVQGNMPGIDQHILENKKALIDYLRKAKMGESTADNFTEGLQTAWKNDQKNLAHHIENIEPSRIVDIEDVGKSYVEKTKESFDQALKDRRKATQEYYDKAEQSLTSVPTTDIRNYIQKVLDKGVKLEDKNIFKDTLNILGKSAEEQLLKEKNPQKLRELFNSLPSEKKAELAKKLGIEIPTQEITERDYFINKLIDSMDLPSNSSAQKDLKQIYGSMQDEMLAKTAHDMGIPSPTIEDLASGTSEVNRIFEDAKQIYDHINNLNPREARDVARSLGLTDEMIPSSQVYAREKSLGDIAADAKRMGDRERKLRSSDLKEVLSSILEKHDPAYTTAAQKYREHSGPVNAITENKKLNPLLDEGRYSGQSQVDPATVGATFMRGASSKTNMEHLLKVLGERGEHQKLGKDYARNKVLEEVLIGEENPVVNLSKLNRWNKTYKGAHVNDKDLLNLLGKLADAQKNLQNKAGRSHRGTKDIYAEADSEKVASLVMNNKQRKKLTEELLNRVGKDTDAGQGFTNAIVEEFHKKASLGDHGKEQVGQKFLDFFDSNKKYIKSVLSPEQYEILKNSAKTSRNALKTFEMGNVGGSHTSTLEQLKDMLMNKEGRGPISDIIQGYSSKSPIFKGFSNIIGKNMDKSTQDMKREFISKILSDDKAFLNMLQKYNTLDNIVGTKEIVDTGTRNALRSFIQGNFKNNDEEKR